MVHRRPATRIDARRHPPRTGSARWVAITFVYMFTPACVASLLTFNLARPFGLS
jgi:hypothetical protein